MFGRLSISNNSSNQCWAYVNNKNFYKSRIHHHIGTSVINGVFYLNVPDDDSGYICFYSFHNEEIFRFKPKTGDLILFPYFFRASSGKIPRPGCESSFSKFVNG